MNSAVIKKVLFIAAVSLAAGWVVRRVAAANVPVVSNVAAQAAS